MGIVELPPWLEELRRVEIVDRVRNDPRSTGNTTLGLGPQDAFRAIGGGRADFDAPSNDLSPDDLALLYAYWNQKGHLEELVEAFRQCFEQSVTVPDNPIVLDIGCGPFTGGLALAASLGAVPRFDYVGVDRAESMRRLGERLADSELVPGKVARHWAPDLASVTWQPRPTWRDVLVIVSYLLASPTLDVPSMCDDLVKILARFGKGATTVFYTNSERPQANLRYPDFQRKLETAGIRMVVEGNGKIPIARLGQRPRRLRYAVFHRPRQTTLSIGAG